MGYLFLPMNRIDSVFITAVPSGESLCSQAEDTVPGDHRPVPQKGESSAAAGRERTAMATAAPGPTAAAAGQEEEQQHASSCSWPPSRQIVPPPDILVNVAGTRYSVGKQASYLASWLAKRCES